MSGIVDTVATVDTKEYNKREEINFPNISDCLSFIEDLFLLDLKTQQDRIWMCRDEVERGFQGAEQLALGARRRAWWYEQSGRVS